MNKKQRVKHVIATTDQPIAFEQIAKKCNCSTSTVYVALEEFRCSHHFAIREASRPKGGNRYYTVIFPVSWSRDDCRAWLNAQTKSGTSRAKIRENDRAQRDNQEANNDTQ